MAEENKMVIDTKPTSELKDIHEKVDKGFIIQAEKVNVFYGEKQAIKNVDISIKPNTVTAFIGPSGCGKSTFLRLFNRMNDYIESFRMDGRIMVNDKDIYHEKIIVEALRKMVGMVFQKPNPFPKSIFEKCSIWITDNG